MAYNNRYSKEEAYGLSMTDIPGVASKPTILRGAKDRNNSRSQSPDRFGGSGKSAELLSSDVVKINEEKVRNQIYNMNKSGVCGPIIGYDHKTPLLKSPKVPDIPLGSSSYKMHFSPGKQRESLPIKLQQSMSVVQTLPTKGSLRHISNGDALMRQSPMNNSFDLKRVDNNFGMKKGTNPTFERTGEDFRIKKNFTTAADRILTKPASYNSTPLSPSKFEEIRKQAQEHLNGYNSNQGRSPVSKTLTARPGEENYNMYNISKPVGKNSLAKEPAGGFNSAALKRSMGFAPALDAHIEKPGMSTNNLHLRTSLQIGHHPSASSFNDPSFHRYRSNNNYGYDVLTGVKKESPNRIL